MRPVGFSTGALAWADFRRGLRTLRGKAQALELSALRLGELPDLVQAIGELDLRGFSYVSVHAPSAFSRAEESGVVDQLRKVPAGWPIVLHPDTITDWPSWLRFGSQLLIENMDKRKPEGRTARELGRIFERLPEAGLCFDLAHARQVDPTMTEALLILREFGSRIRQIHLSEVSTGSKHARLSYGAILAYRGIGPRIPSVVPIILEGPVGEKDVETEMELARQALPEVNVTITNNIPPPDKELMEGAVRDGIDNLPGEWNVTLLADPGTDEYVVKVRRDGGPTWKWVFVDAFEQRPEVVRDRIWNGLREKIRQLVQSRRHEVLELVRKHGGANVRLFGSQARGDFQPDSDLDLLLNLEEGRSLFDLIDIKLELQKLLGCKVDVVTEDGLRPEARDRILGEAVPL